MPGMSVARLGGMKRVKTVRSGCRFASSAAMGSTRSIHGVGQGPSGEKSRCMSTHRCSVWEVKGYECNWPAKGVSGQGFQTQGELTNRPISSVSIKDDLSNEFG